MAPIKCAEHPETGASYFIVMPINAAVLSEIRDGYRHNETPWMKVIDHAQFRHVFAQFRNKRAVFCAWLHHDATWLPSDRRALFVPVYAEAIDDDVRNLLPQHKMWLDTFVGNAKHFDGVFGHTPWMTQTLARLTGLRAALLPAGVEAAVLGTPRWDAQKTCDAAWYGTMAGKRQSLIRKLQDDKRWKFENLTGLLSRRLVDRLQSAKSVLYLGHSNVRSYSTWRTWHSISSSACIVTEPGDYWPLEPDLCVEIPRVDDGNVGAIIEQIRDLPASEALRIARAAHERLHQFTVRRSIDEYIVAGTREWLR